MPKLVQVPGGKLKLFNTLAIETGGVCNRSCVFCPNHHKDRPDEYMPDKLIIKMINELVRLNYKGRITNYIYNEPMRDKRCLDIISYFRRALPRVCVMTSTNGDYIKDKQDIASLLNAGVNQLLINVYSASDGDPDPLRVAHGIKLSEARYHLLQGWVDELALNQSGSLYTYVRPPGRVVRVLPKFGVQNTDKSLAEYELQNRSGNIEWFQSGMEEPLDRGCTRPFRMLNINWRGEAILCCNDYHGATNFGSVGDHTLEELWNCEGMNRYRLYLQNKRRDIALCDKCDYRGGVYPHMIDTVTFGPERDSEILGVVS